MNKTLAIQLKAAFLLFIFSLNMFVGFACSIGIVVNGSPQHAKEITKTTHTHTHTHGNKDSKDHQLNGHKSHDHKKDHQNKKDKKGCCNDEVQKIQQLDKNINTIAKNLSIDNFFTITQLYYRADTKQFLIANPAKLRERFFYPPPPNILINIQRFQI